MLDLHLPPHEYLPADILREIFSHVIARNGIVDIPRRLTDTLPWSLGQVCSNWREIVHSDPRLWRNIQLRASITELGNGYLDRLDRILPYSLPALYIKEDDNMERNPKRSKFTLGTPILLKLRSLWIQASPALIVELLSAIPSSIALPELSLDVSESETMIPELQNTELFTVTKNLTSLRLAACHSTLAKALLHMPHIPFERLTNLDVGHLCWVPDLWNILSRCISLKEVSLPIHVELSILPRISHPFLPHLEALKILGSHAICCDPFPLKQLTTLSIAFVTPWCMINVLRQTAQLESLFLKYILFELCDDTVQHVLRLDTVQSLSVDVDSLPVLNFFDCPKLARLFMTKSSGEFKTPALPAREIRDFVARTGCILESFHFGSPLNGKKSKIQRQLRSVLNALPSLRDLSSIHLQFSDKLLDEMKENTLLPKVQMLKICVASATLFADVIESRVNAGLKEEEFIRLKTAFAYYPVSYTDDGEVIVPESALQKLEAMNSMYGTDFRMTIEGNGIKQ